MIDPKPLFDEEADTPPADSTAGCPRPPRALELFDETMPHLATTGPSVKVAPLELNDGLAVLKADFSVRAVGLDEVAGLAQAIERGKTKFPAVMRESGFLVRNSLNQLLPLDFEKLTVFGGATLERVASLITDLADFNGRLHEIDAERSITHVVEAARVHAAHKRQSSILGLLGELVPFDARAADFRIGAVHRALLLRLEHLAALSDALKRLQRTLVVEVTTLAILEDMSDHGAFGDPLARRAILFTTSLQETATAFSQIESLKMQIQAWTMRCDEVRTITLPALGYTGSP